MGKIKSESLPVEGAQGLPIDLTSDVDPEIDKVSTKEVGAYDHRQERWPNAVAFTEEWATLEDGRRRIHEVLTEPFEVCQYHDKYTEGHLKSCKEALLYVKQDGIKVGISGGTRQDRSLTLNSLVRHFEDPLKKLGIVVVDAAILPTAEYLVVLTDVAGAKDDPGVSAQVTKMCALGKNRVVVVLPHSGTTGDDTFPAGDRDQANTVLTLEKKCTRLRSKVNEIDALVLRYEEALDWNQAGIHGQRKRKYEVLAKHADNALESRHLSIANDHIKALLKELLARSSDAAAKAPILSISIDAYAEHEAGYSPKATPVLSAEGTNVPALRRLVASFPNEARLNEARHRQDVAIPKLLTRLQLYASGEVRERKLALDVHLKQPESQSEDMVRGSFEVFRMKFETSVGDAIRHQSHVWATRAAVKCTEYEGQVSPEVLHTLMKRRGSRTAAAGRDGVDMTSDLIAISSVALNHAFNGLLFDSVRSCIIVPLVQDTRRLSNTLIRTLQEHSRSFSVEFNALVEFLHTTETELQASIEKMAKTIRRGLEDIQRKACEADDDAYLHIAMLPVYDEVWQLQAYAVDPVTREKTKEKNQQPRPQEGWIASRKATFRRHVASADGVWAVVQQSINRDVEALLVQQMAAMQAEIRTAFRDIRRDFERTCSGKFSSSPEELELQQALLKNIEEAREHLDGPMRRAFDALEQSSQQQ